LAAYLYVEQKEPDAGRLTKDIDIEVWARGPAKDRTSRRTVRL
jgi:hypothetical protein